MTAKDDILSSWTANANNWIASIDNAELESRVLVTNNAIVQAINEFPVQTLLDIGCGEGWLTRTLRQQGKDCWGVDATEALVNNAIAKDGPFYTQATYRSLVSGQQIMPVLADAAVINFALIDKEDTAALLPAIPQYLVPRGLLFIQTLHPLAIAMNGEYSSGWKDGSWNGMKRNFEQPYQWYFRTLEDWWQLFANEYTLLALREPVHPVTKKPMSVIFILQIK